MENYISRNMIFYLKICITLALFTGALANICHLWNNARYFNGYCYYVSNTTLPYKQAKTSCEEMDTARVMRLAEPKTDTQYLFLTDMVKSLNLSVVSDKHGTGVLLGSVRNGQKNSFIWSSGGAVRNWWYSGKPDDYKNKENCLEIRFVFDLKLNDIDCYQPNYYACEKYIGNPCDSVLAGGEYYGGFCYKLYNEKLAWNDTIKACEKESGHLAEPRSLELTQFLLLIIRTTTGQSDLDSYYLGATDEQSEGTFKWLSDGGLMTVDLWGVNEPSNNGDAENYLTIRALKMKFNDVAGKFKYKFFCQREAWTHTYLVVLPKKALFFRAQLMVASSGRHSDGFYSVETKWGENCGTNKTSESAFLEVAVALEPQKSIELDPCLGMTSSGFFKQYVRIRSSQELTVILSSPHKTLNSFDITASLILRTALLTQNYFLLSVPQGSGQLTVTALTENGADVILKVPRTYRQDAILSITGVSVRSSGYASVTLDMYQTVVFDIRQLRVGFIYATNAVAVYNLAGVTTAPEENTLSSYSLDMLIPVELMTAEYITFPSWPLTEQPESYQLLALHDNTEITVYAPYSEAVVLSLAGDAREITLPGSAFYYLKSNVPFQARKTSTGSTKGTCVTTLLPPSMWRAIYVYVTPSINVFTTTETNNTNITMSSVLFLIAEYPEFDISYLVAGSCLKIEGTNLFGCYFPITWGMSEPVYITNNGTKFAAYAAWVRENSTLLTCYPLGVDTSGTYWQDFDGPDNINFNNTACNLDNEFTTVDSSVSSTIQTLVILNDTAEPTTDSTPAALSKMPDGTPTNWSNPALTTLRTDLCDSLKQTGHDLGVNHKNTSLYRRSKVSIADMRVSSVTIGVIGVLLLTIFCALFVFPDFLSLIKYIIARCLFENESPTAR